MPPVRPNKQENNQEPNKEERLAEAPKVRLAVSNDGMPSNERRYAKALGSPPPTTRLAVTTAMTSTANDSGKERYPFHKDAKPSVQLASTGSMTTGGKAGREKRYPFSQEAPPNVRLAHVPGAQGDNVLIGRNGVERMSDTTLPALLVSYYYLDKFEEHQDKYYYRDWVMDSGAFSAHSSGVVINLQDYIDCCHRLMQNDPTLTEIYALDVIGDWKGTKKNTEKMWKQGVPAIPCFHYGEPWGVLKDYCAQYPKVALGGCVGKRDKLKFIGQCFARAWPHKFHGFGFGHEDAILGFPFHCMNDEHEILTKDGWKGRGKVKVGDEILAFNDGESQWESVLDVYDYEVDNISLIHLDNRTFSARVTDNHRWRVFNIAHNQWEWTTSTRFHSKDRIPRRADYNGPTKKVYEDWFVEIFAWYWTEGCIRRKKKFPNRRASIEITQSPSANPEKVRDIRRAIKESGEKYCEYVRKNTGVYKRDMIAWELYGHVRDKLLEISPNKEIPLSFILALSKEQLELFIRTSIAADGSAHRRIEHLDCFSLCQKDGKNIEEFRIACTLAGYATSPINGYRTSTGSIMSGVQSLSNEWIDPNLWNRARHLKLTEQKKVPYSGHVWCVRVRSGAFFTKCRGHVYVTGNSTDATNWELTPCLTGGSLISTSKGLIPIKELVGKEFSVNTHTQTLVARCKAVSKGVKETITLLLNTGQYLTCTPDHKILTDNGWLEARELETGDKVRIVDRQLRTPIIEESLEDEMFGWMTGDGFYCSNQRWKGEVDSDSAGLIFALGKSGEDTYDEEAMERLLPIWDSFVGRENASQSQRKVNSDVLQVRTEDSKVMRKLRELGFKTGRAVEKRLPTYIFTATANKQLSFLKGLFSADGGVKKYPNGMYECIVLASNSTHLLDEVQILLLEFGIQSTVYWSHPPGHKNEQGQLNISGLSALRYMEIIGFNLSRKNKKFGTSDGRKRKPRKWTYKREMKEYAIVKEVIENVSEEVYDILMPSQHHFVANGIVVHNCGFGRWRAFGGAKISVRGSSQNLRCEVLYYLELEQRAREKWKKEMALLEEKFPIPSLYKGVLLNRPPAPIVRLAESGMGSYNSERQKGKLRALNPNSDKKASKKTKKR